MVDASNVNIQSWRSIAGGGGSGSGTRGAVPVTAGLLTRVTVGGGGCVADGGIRLGGVGHGEGGSRYSDARVVNHHGKPVKSREYCDFVRENECRAVVGGQAIRRGAGDWATDEQYEEWRGGLGALDRLCGGGGGCSVLG